MPSFSAVMFRNDIILGYNIFCDLTLFHYIRCPYSFLCNLNICLLLAFWYQKDLSTKPSAQAAVSDLVDLGTLHFHYDYSRTFVDRDVQRKSPREAEDELR